MKKIVFVLILLFLVVYDLFSQCSDAGICSLKDHRQKESKKFSVGLSYIYGKSSKTDDIDYHTARLDGLIFFDENATLSFLLPFNQQKGPLGTVNGIGDAIIVGEYTVIRSDHSSIKAQAGMKLASGDANKNSALPQMYQSGLGSTDILLGVTGTMDMYYATLGYQIAGGRSSNGVTQLKRGDDLLVKVGREFDVEPFTVNLSTLFIQRIGKSSVRDSSSIGTYIDLPNSAQAQLNFVADIDVKLNEAIIVKSGIALPFLKRSINVDGLTRALTLSIGIQTSF